MATRFAVLGMQVFKRNGRIKRMPLAGGWTGTRDLPAPERTTFLNSEAETLLSHYNPINSSAH